MTLQDISDAIKAQMTGLKSWFDDGANHLGNIKIMQLTLGQESHLHFAFMLIIFVLAATFLNEFQIMPQPFKHWHTRLT